MIRRSGTPPSGIRLSGITFVLATANPDKASEIDAILGPVLADAGRSVQLLPRPPEVPEVEETGSTLEANARLKAQALVDATGQPAIADDTGLQVDALDGAPGVRSARFAGDDATYADNVALLLERLAKVPDEHRTARFATVAVASWPDGRAIAAYGEVEGRITQVPRGSRGFGYDPVFEPVEGKGRTFAEMAPSEKHACSHRGRAFRTLAEGVRAVLAAAGEATLDGEQ